LNGQTFSRDHFGAQGWIGTTLIALAGEPLMIFELMAR
jgi:hypothetical protein